MKKILLCLLLPVCAHAQKKDSAVHAWITLNSVGHKGDANKYSKDSAVDKRLNYFFRPSMMVDYPRVGTLEKFTSSQYYLTDERGKRIEISKQLFDLLLQSLNKKKKP